MAASGENIPSCFASQGTKFLGFVTGSDVCDYNGQPESDSLKGFVPQSEDEDNAEEGSQSMVESAPQGKEKKKPKCQSVWQMLA